jgi:hypothetical protein
VGSVIATWVGQCEERAARRELCLRMADLGELSHSFFKPAPPLIKQFDQRIEGDILVSKHLFPSPPSTPKLTQVSERFFSLQGVSLFGVEFRLYDGRGLYEGDDRMSFVFCVDDDPQIDGLMVYVEEREECRKYKDERIQRADYLLNVPHIHLRYYLEEWLDQLMGWVKYHHVKNLEYWRYEDMWINQDSLTDHFGQIGQYEYYEILKLRLEYEVESWTGIAEEASRFWKSVREPGGE